MDYDEEYQRYVEHVRKEVVPMVEESNIFVSIYTGNVDVKFATELGLAIMYDKPIIGVIQPGSKISEKMAKVVDRFVELDMDDPQFHERLAAEIEGLHNE